jgi:hypothetical protein
MSKQEYFTDMQPFEVVHMREDHTSSLCPKAHLLDPHGTERVQCCPECKARFYRDPTSGRGINGKGFLDAMENADCSAPRFRAMVLDASK